MPGDSEDGIMRTMEVQLGNKRLSKRNQLAKDLVTAVQRLVLLVPADELEQGPSTTRGQPQQVGLADVPKQPKQPHHAEDDLPAQVGSLAPILGEDQEEKEEVSPSLGRCRQLC